MRKRILISGENVDRSLRVLAAIFVGYLAVNSYVAVLSLLLVVAGVSRSEAIVFSILTSVPVYLAISLWIIATERFWTATIGLLCFGLIGIFGTPILVRAD